MNRRRPEEADVRKWDPLRTAAWCWLLLSMVSIVFSLVLPSYEMPRAAGGLSWRQPLDFDVRLSELGGIGILVLVVAHAVFWGNLIGAVFAVTAPRGLFATWARVMAVFTGVLLLMMIVGQTATASGISVWAARSCVVVGGPWLTAWVLFRGLPGAMRRQEAVRIPEGIRRLSLLIASLGAVAAAVLFWVESSDGDSMAGAVGDVIVESLGIIGSNPSGGDVAQLLAIGGGIYVVFVFLCFETSLWAARGIYWLACWIMDGFRAKEPK